MCSLARDGRVPVAAQPLRVPQRLTGSAVGAFFRIHRPRFHSPHVLLVAMIGCATRVPLLDGVAVALQVFGDLRFALLMRAGSLDLRFSNGGIRN